MVETTSVPPLHSERTTFSITVFTRRRLESYSYLVAVPSGATDFVTSLSAAPVPYSNVETMSARSLSGALAFSFLRSSVRLPPASYFQTVQPPIGLTSLRSRPTESYSNAVLVLPLPKRSYVVLERTFPMRSNEYSVFTQRLLVATVFVTLVHTVGPVQTASGVSSECTSAVSYEKRPLPSQNHCVATRSSGRYSLRTYSCPFESVSVRRLWLSVSSVPPAEYVNDTVFFASGQLSIVMAARSFVDPVPAVPSRYSKDALRQSGSDTFDMRPFCPYE